MLVLLPGLDGTGRLFQPFMRELPSSWRVVVVAYPMDAGANYEALTRLVLGSLPADGPFLLLGESFSGPIAIKIAAALGPRVRGLILCCSFARNPRPLLRRFAAAIDGLPAPTRVPSALPAYVLLGAKASAECRELLAKVLTELPLDVLRARLGMVMNVDVTRELAAIAAPVLYLQATQDRVVPASAAAEIQLIQARAQLIQLSGPHGLLQAAPAASAAAVASVFPNPDSACD